MFTAVGKKVSPPPPNMALATYLLTRDNKHTLLLKCTGDFSTSLALLPIEACGIAIGITIATSTLLPFMLVALGKNKCELYQCTCDSVIAFLQATGLILTL